MALRTLGAASLGPGPIRRRLGAWKTVGLCMRHLYGECDGLATMEKPQSFLNQGMSFALFPTLFILF